MDREAPPTGGIQPGTKLCAVKSRTYFFLVMYAVLAIAGGILIAQNLTRNQNPSGTAGFMVIFGVGMIILTLVKGRRPQVSLYEEYLQVNQSRKPRYIYYKNIISLSRPDSNRLILRLWEKGIRQDVTVWLKELDRSEVEKLAAFLSEKSRKPQ